MPQRQAFKPKPYLDPLDPRPATLATKWPHVKAYLKYCYELNDKGKPYTLKEIAIEFGQKYDGMRKFALKHNWSQRRKRDLEQYGRSNVALPAGFAPPPAATPPDAPAGELPPLPELPASTEEAQFACPHCANIIYVTPQFADSLLAMRGAGWYAKLQNTLETVHAQMEKELERIKDKPEAAKDFTNLARNMALIQKTAKDLYGAAMGGVGGAKVADLNPSLAAGEMSQEDSDELEYVAKLLEELRRKGPAGEKQIINVGAGILEEALEAEEKK